MVEIEMPWDCQLLHQPNELTIEINNITDCQSRLSDERLETDIIAPLRQLMDVYRMYLNDGEGRRTVSGGMQQYLIRQRQQLRSLRRTEEDVGLSVVQSTQPSAVGIHNVPDSILLHIFSYLDAKDLCRMSGVCQHMYRVSSDKILWQQKLERDVKNWELIGHTTYPSMYKECQSDWPNKEIYLRCCPEINQMRRQENVQFHYLSSVLRSLWPRKAPKVAMFGPGLESSTSGLVRNIMWDKSGIFTQTAMFPGQFGGVGAGFTIRIQNNNLINLTTLYTSNKKQRENIPQGERLRYNMMMQENVEAGDQAEQEPQYELKQAVKDLCRTLDGFIYVVDASTENPLTLSSCQPELFAMLNERWSAPSLPLLVLVCVASTDRAAVAPIHVADQLNLGNLNRPWQVRKCTVERLEDIAAGMEWVQEQAVRR